ncbi:hypothetical protein HNY73_019514 [Argiope bruennichi]|uniref:Uncharacterized protein n=1 Tax=Argiope bruennichi TaxID=94029 RepID=A0A8T0E6A7_ARGBR|nr:hypothetical protein HNY73_019514 [Argiope bruennichi]
MDDQLPPENHSEWEKFSTELQCINNIKVSRCILPFSDVEAIELHGFSDASEAAFGAVVYCKSQTPAGEVVVRWWPVNPEMAPLKKPTIPRLELCACCAAGEIDAAYPVGSSTESVPISLL